jgi:hypothetical protein
LPKSDTHQISWVSLVGLVWACQTRVASVTRNPGLQHHTPVTRNEHWAAKVTKFHSKSPEVLATC